MVDISSLQKSLGVSQKKNRKSFSKVVDRILQANGDYPFSKGIEGILEDLEESYLNLAKFLIKAQKEEGKEIRSQVTLVCESLVLAAIRFHVVFFQPNLLGLAEEKSLKKLLRKMKKTFSDKNADYGNAFRFWGVPGLVVRMGDKYFRLSQLVKEKYQAKVDDERIPDTALDLSNYGIMLLMLMDEGRPLKLGE